LHLEGKKVVGIGGSADIVVDKVGGIAGLLASLILDQYIVLWLMIVFLAKIVGGLELQQSMQNKA
jgi:hypothetical protein